MKYESSELRLFRMNKIERYNVADLQIQRYNAAKSANLKVLKLLMDILLINIVK